MAEVAHAARSMLFVHGAGGGGWEWTVWQGVFAAEGIVVDAPDLQPSPSGLVETCIEDYARQVRSALATLPRPRVLVGASLGGLLAMLCASDADALVLVNPLPPSPWQAGLPLREWPDVVPWRRDARLDGTRRALPDADDATVLFAFRHWRDEGGRVLREAHAGIAVERPPCPTLLLASLVDDDVPPVVVRTLATEWQADFEQVPAVSHAGPLLGRSAAECAARALSWLSQAMIGPDCREAV